MAHRRCLHALTCRAATTLLSSTTPNALSLHPIKTPFSTSIISLKTLTNGSLDILSSISWGPHTRLFSSSRGDSSENEEQSGEEEQDYDDDDNTVSGSVREYSAEEKEEEAAAIGYKVVGPLQKEDRVFKPYEPVFAVIRIGSHQFKVSNGDCIFTERLKFCEVNDKLILNKVLLVGSAIQTIIGRPIVPDAAVHAVVEEHALDAKVIIFKKKRRKNYRRTKGHRQELTKLRITDIQGIEKQEMKVEGSLQ
ncbi:Ribosomal_L21p domain-containing protein [Cephalotus follicularis]|uniref:Large ribosomal subunit protein bL21m n=1 Tax=Cephalotus follicularis TaxID=3775 RepID=A0A1Q3D8B4_CEPFO|nr:Ribosomal_L21p domain-containing protein [Cephalotus follicularis]